MDGTCESCIKQKNDIPCEFCSTKTTIKDLPKDLLKYITGFLTKKDNLEFRLTNKDFLNVLKNIDLNSDYSYKYLTDTKMRDYINNLEVKELKLKLNLNLKKELKLKDISNNFNKVTSLELIDLTDEDVKAIATNLKNLTSLKLWSENITDEGAKAIATNLKNLTSLNLWSNNITDEGAKAIATNLKNLTSLILFSNIGDEGVKAIATNLKNLTKLFLKNNNIGDEGAKAIATNLKNLTNLNNLTDIW